MEKSPNLSIPRSGDLPTDKWVGTPEHFENAKANTTRAFNSYVEEDAPDHPWQKLVKRQLNPNIVGAAVAVASAAVLVLDTVNSGPSSFVVNNPEAATTALAAGTAAIGALASKMVRDGNAEELKQAREAEREQIKQAEEEKTWWK